MCARGEGFQRKELEQAVKTLSACVKHDVGHILDAPLPALRGETPAETARNLKVGACRSPYCECSQGRCSHPGFYDARSEPMPEPAQATALPVQQERARPRP